MVCVIWETVQSELWWVCAWWVCYKGTEMKLYHSGKAAIIYCAIFRFERISKPGSIRSAHEGIPKELLHWLFQLDFRLRLKHGKGSSNAADSDQSVRGIKRCLSWLRTLFSLGSGLWPVGRLDNSTMVNDSMFLDSSYLVIFIHSNYKILMDSKWISTDRLGHRSSRRCLAELKMDLSDR